MLVSIVLAAGLVVQSQRKQVATYVVPIDELGRPGRITLASENYQPDDRVSGYFVGEVVKLARERPLDPVVTRKNLVKAYDYLVGDAVSAMNQYAAADGALADALARGMRIARSVEITSILQKGAGNYQVRWVETTYANGQLKSKEQWTGLFDTKLIAPRNDEETFRNPLGLFVTGFQWSREFTGNITPATEAQAESAELPVQSRVRNAGAAERSGS